MYKIGSLYAKKKICFARQDAWLCYPKLASSFGENVFQKYVSFLRVR